MTIVHDQSPDKAIGSNVVVTETDESSLTIDASSTSLPTAEIPTSGSPTTEDGGSSCEDAKAAARPMAEGKREQGEASAPTPSSTKLSSSVDFLTAKSATMVAVPFDHDLGGFSLMGAEASVIRPGTNNGRGGERGGEAGGERGEEEVPSSNRHGAVAVLTAAERALQWVSTNVEIVNGDNGNFSWTVPAAEQHQSFRNLFWRRYTFNPWIHHGRSQMARKPELHRWRPIKAANALLGCVSRECNAAVAILTL
jgi:hypothetical protein